MTTTSVMAIIVAVAACVTDLRGKRIPNALTIGGALAAIAFHWIADGRYGLLTATTGWLVGAAIFFVPFALRGLGGGDVKLIAALGAFIGPGDALWLALYAGVAGGCLALIVALYHGYLRQAVTNVRILFNHWSASGLKPLHEVSLEGGSGPRLAYAIPIFCGLVMTLWLR